VIYCIQNWTYTCSLFVCKTYRKSTGCSRTGCWGEHWSTSEENCI